ncbi:effector protein [Campylobacter rectus]|uniref:effector protein n=1 Tax=Campylobacter rectus TaxID=203 RepID=UPI0028E23309|nr:effector protein [Campylobacter rectus]
MKFKDIQDKNSGLFDFFAFEDECYKEFISLCIREYKSKFTDLPWEFASDDKRFNSFPNFLFKHQTCISHLKFKDATFQFRICNEDNLGSFGYRLFINLKDGTHLDFVSSDISKVDAIAMELKTKFLNEFKFISKCGWWITDIWKNMYPVCEDSDTTDFLEKILSENFTAQMIKVNNKLLEYEVSGAFVDIIKKLKSMD